MKNVYIVSKGERGEGGRILEVFDNSVSARHFVKTKYPQFKSELDDPWYFWADDVDWILIQVKTVKQG